MKKALIILISILALVLAGCGPAAAPETPGDGAGGGSYLTITAEEAKARLDSEEGIIIVDVRTPEEYAEKHIPGAILLPVDTIADEAENVIPDKEATYFIYCRSGNRSATAAAQLVEMGYKNIVDFGGIIDWPYETVSGE